MNDNENRKHQMLLRAQQFLTGRGSDFGPGSLVKDLGPDLGGVINELDSHAAAENSGTGTARQGTVTRAMARAALREDLEAINRTARAIMDERPGLNEKFRLPRQFNDQHLLDAARAFAADALPLKADFIAHEMPGNFIEDLDADILALEAAINDQSGGIGHRIAASASIDDAMERGAIIIRKLDAIIRNKYANDRAALAEWTSASHTERAPRHRHEPDAGGQPPAPTTGGTPPPA
ncbi:MAG TPA: hypothetical protein VKC61_21595 [Pyrinomonadaceae bacterium]|nr:hypothetical protein [Pyrinomonadaceae bacterium]